MSLYISDDTPVTLAGNEIMLNKFKKNIHDAQNGIKVVST
jgi:hypothetical protein